ncbi:MAG: hypothetical protein CMJ65_11245 [Planctomycetaceae bacterium]|nr:hypothetical protein [Planctomycetaceae bacterium]
MDFVVLLATISNNTIPTIVQANPATPSSNDCRSPLGSFKAFGGLLKAAEASPPLTSIKLARANQLFLRIFISSTCHRCCGLLEAGGISDCPCPGPGVQPARIGRRQPITCIRNPGRLAWIV